MNRIQSLFQRKNKEVLNIYFTAGHPTKDSIQDIVLQLDSSGADIIELGMPYSDPLADGPTIQDSSQKALANGVTLNYIFEQVSLIREHSQIPIIMMGYYNQMLQFGEKKFLKAAQDAGVDGLIIPDMPMYTYEENYKDLFEQHNITISFLVTPETSKERIVQADRLSSAFLYIVSQSSITGTASKATEAQKSYFNMLQELELKSPSLIGFGIKDYESFHYACQYANGAIIGSAFIKTLESSELPIKETVDQFVKKIRIPVA